MGNGCSLKLSKFVECCPTQNIITNISKSEQILTREISKFESDKEKKLSFENNENYRVQVIIKYFNEEEKEILTDLYKQRDKDKIFTRNKDNTKYELMLKRLLEQQNIKIIGPKRRETIRNEGHKIKEMVTQILQENKTSALKTSNNKDKENEDNTLFIYPTKKKGRLSQTIDKNILINNKIKKDPYNLIKEQD